MRLIVLIATILIPAIAGAEHIGSAQRDGVHDRPAKKMPDDDHRVARGERLRVVLYDAAGPDTETIQEVAVDRTGNIGGLPLLKKPIRAAGRTVVQLELAIRDAYEDEKQIHDISLRVEVIKGATTRPAK